MSEHYEHLVKWTHPPDYGGFSPIGDYVIAGRSRDSDCLEESNYACIFRDLEKFAESLPEPPENEDIESGEMSWVYDFGAGHWAVGWVETLLIRQDAPEELLRFAESIVCAIADYPVYDDEHFSELELEHAEKTWRNCFGLSERIELCRKFGISIFAARHEYLPDDDSGELFQYLRE